MPKTQNLSQNVVKIFDFFFGVNYFSYNTPNMRPEICLLSAFVQNFTYEKKKKKNKQTNKQTNLKKK
jgi:hypothetical protein